MENVYQEIKKAVESCPTMAKAADSIGMSHTHFRRRAIEFGLYKKNPGRKGIPRLAEKPQDEILIENIELAGKTIKKYILQKRLLDYSCGICGISDWLDKDISLEIDHINGIRTDNRIENLRFLCPNCHSQTEFFRGRNIKRKDCIPDSELLKAYKENGTIRKALLSLGLAGKGGNYRRMKKLLN